MSRTGTGEEPNTGLPTKFGPWPLLHPATFSTVTSTLPWLSTPLMKTCRNPTIVTGVCPLEPMVLPESKIGREIIELLLVTGVPLANPALTTGLFLPARIWNG